MIFSTNRPPSDYLERLAFQGPLEHFFFCRSLSTPEDLSKAQRYGFAKTFQPSAAAIALAAHRMKKIAVPLTPTVLRSGAPLGEIGDGWLSDRLLSAPVANELGLLWEELGDLTQDAALASLGQRARKWAENLGCDVGPLFEPERHFQERPRQGKRQKFADPSLGLATLAEEEMSVGWTLCGWNTGLGAMRLKEVEIRSFGPQSMPLNDLSQFGLAHLHPTGAVGETKKDGMGLEGWTRCLGAKEVWLSFQGRAKQGRIDFDVRWAGLEPKQSMGLVFYVKASECAWEGKGTLFPRSLQRMQGIGQRVLLGKTARLESSEAMAMQVIPLAGEGCFWNTSFLISFEFSSLLTTSSFSFYLI